jgi:hypothetical protein
MKKYIAALVLLALLLAIPTIIRANSDNLSIREMVNEMNTPENVQAISSTLDNQALLSSFLTDEKTVNLFTNTTEFRVLVGDDEFYFIKNKGIYDSCSNCDDVVSVLLQPKSISFADDNQELLRQIALEGKVSFDTLTMLEFKYWFS